MFSLGSINPGYFYEALPVLRTWRIKSQVSTFEILPDQVIFLSIERLISQILRAREFLAE